jgi:hypothetical protein
LCAGTMGGMDAKRKPSDARKVLVLLAVLCLPPAYVLSCGPAAWLAVNKYIPQRAFIAYVTPLAAARKACPPLHTAMNWYLGLWVGQ